MPTPTINGQWEVAGLLLGTGTRYPIEAVSGLGSPDAKSAEIDLFDRDGGWSGRERLQSREVILTIGVDGDPDTPAYANLIDNLAGAWKPSDDDVVARWMRFGRVRRLNVRPRGLELDWDEAFHLGAAVAAGRLIALDPLVYDETETEVSGTGAVQVTNSGNYPTWATITVTTPSESVTLRNDTDSARQLTLVDLATNASVDLRTRTVTAGGESVNQAVQPGSLWWRLLPGVNNLNLSGAAGFTVTFRNAWTTG